MPTPSAPPAAIVKLRDRGRRHPPRRVFTDRSSGDVVLRMSIAREGIGLELARPAPIGCARVLTLASTFAGVRFPVNVSGGVTRFRHRRARLERFELELNARALERWVAPRLREAGWQQTPEVWVGFDSPEKITLSVSTPFQPGDPEPQTAPAVAFDLHAVSDRDDLVLVVSNARGIDLPGPATAIAIACVEAAIGSRSKRQGATFTFQRCVAMVARELLPQAGARVPSAEGVECSLSLVDHDTWRVSARRQVRAAAPRDSTLRAREAAALTKEADDELASGDFAAARAACLHALERAPRHPEIVRRMVEIDMWTTGRAEAALEMIAEIEAGPSADFGIARGELLREAGDIEQAVASFERAAESERAPAIAALAYQRAARFTMDAETANRWLDRAVVRAPRAAAARWARVRARLALGRVREAVADVEHLDAMSPGAAAKSAVWMRAGRTWQAFGMHGQARTLFERALRFVPDDPDALAGLAAALLSEGATTRGVALLTRALQLAARRDSTSSIRLGLARAFGDHLGDLPAAIAHAVAIPDDDPHAPVARGLEGRWRARLGDTAGASLAFGRLRELAESLVASLPVGSQSSPEGPFPLDDDVQIQQVVDFLREAARWEGSERLDPLAAKGHLSAALRLRPRDAATQHELRELGSPRSPPMQADRAAVDPTGRSDGLNVADPNANEPSGALSVGSLDLMGDDDVPATDVEGAARVEDLTRRLQIDPSDDGVADELASLLEALGRGHELLALLSARLDDASAERRVALVPRVRATLERLAALAQAKGQSDEASLYRAVAAGLDDPK